MGAAAKASGGDKKEDGVTTGGVLGTLGILGIIAAAVVLQAYKMSFNGSSEDFRNFYNIVDAVRSITSSPFFGAGLAILGTVGVMQKKGTPLWKAVSITLIPAGIFMMLSSAPALNAG